MSLAQKLSIQGQVAIEYENFEAKKEDVLGILYLSSVFIFTKFLPLANLAYVLYLDVMKDLLDLYTHHKTYTTVGDKYSAETFIAIRIALNKAAAEESSSGVKINGDHHTSNGKAKKGGISALAPGITGLSEKDKIAIGESVRFMLDGERERKERKDRKGL